MRQSRGKGAEEKVYEMKKKPVIVLTGPTAVGKTELSLRLAEEVSGSIVSADSMQVYRRMDIGSAKIMPEEMRGIPHYLIDVLDPEEDFNVFLFQKMAKQAMEKIWAMGEVPIITGGTGFYIQAVLRDIDFSEDQGKTSYREYLEKLAEEQGTETLHEMMRAVDPKAAEEIHPNNQKRVIRALEFFHETGSRISAHNEEQKEKESPYCFLYFVLTDDREVLYDRIDRRVDRMVENGLVDEVKALMDSGLTEEHVSMKGLGYKELFPYFRGEYDLDEAVRIIKRDTRHFAKRQLTWFNREQHIVWLDKRDFDHDEDAMLAYMVSLWRAKLSAEESAEAAEAAEAAGAAAGAAE
ncbi:MAG: tRNA (adenosine(37)-N6)-dimethylallyltransferase MiaA [Eubacterium sp.]|nr:tRNA (adenosine(37)-N6)-dimethylallyltransferase MiaA [Eubacterium sp.]